MKDYNGWTNNETWLLAVFIQNNEFEYNMWMEFAKVCRAKAEGTDKAPRDLLEVLIKSYYTDEMPQVDKFWADLMRAALDKVNWSELADAALEFK